MQIKVITWNIWRGKYLDGVIDFLKSSNADIIGLQEIIEDESLTSRENLAQIIAKSLGYNYVYCKAFTTDRHMPIYDIGNAILSKYEIQNTMCIELSGLSDYKSDSTTEPRNAIKAEITINNRTLTILNTHLAYSHELKPFELRTKQVEKLIPPIKSQNTILMGDFNSMLENEEMKRIQEVIPNADTSTEKQATWSVYPTDYKGFIVKGLEYRIDNIFVSNDIRVVNFAIESSRASDHLPISVLVEI